MCDVENSSIKMDLCHLLLSVDVTQEAWIAEYVNGRSCVEENTVRVVGPLLKECVIMDE